MEDLTEMALNKDAATNDTPEIPAKFIDAKTGEVRIDALVKSYLEMERQLSQRVRIPSPDDDDDAKSKFRAAMGVPDAPDGYAFDNDRIGFEPDQSVTERLHAAGLTQEQAQLVYELAGEHLSPMVEVAAADFEAGRQEAKLIEHFGSEDRWKEAARQMRKWGEKRLHPDTMQALSCTHEGCLAMHKMMQEDAPPIFQGETDGEDVSLEGLRKLMQDPRYWRDNDPKVVEQVSAGFKRLYD